MTSTASDQNTVQEGPELVFGLIGALGSGLEEVGDTLSDALADMGYKPVHIRASSLLREIPRWKDLPDLTDPLETYISKLQEAGNQLRESTNLGGAMAGLAIGEIQRVRSQTAPNQAERPLARHAYIIRSLKHQDEVSTLRRVYGDAFFGVAAYSPAAAREARLARAIANSHGSGLVDDYAPKARQLMQRDDAERDNPMGQRVGVTFPLADVFFTSHRPAALKKEVERFVEIVFGHPFHTPTPDEFAMFHARAAALRSADLSRQVGAVIASERGDIVSVGTNEVPCPGGGSYWEGDALDHRDFQLGKSMSDELRQIALSEVIARLMKKGLLQLPNGKTVEAAMPDIAASMRGTLLMGLGEFGRTVHAEMAALLDAARRGVIVAGQTLYATTFPCHNCAKHIIAAGIARVVYIEPFPKSQTGRLYSDAVVIDAPARVPSRVNFEPFVGVAPRRYMEFFEKPVRESADGTPVRWHWQGAMPRFGQRWPAATFGVAENAVIFELERRMKRSGLIDDAEQGQRKGGEVDE